MSSSSKNFIIGLFVLVAIGIAVISLLLLRPSVGDGREKLLVRFSTIDKVNVGTRVTFAGKAVGEVTSIRAVEDPRNQKADTSGRLYVYELTLKMDSKVRVYPSDEISLQTAGLFGEKLVAITPRAPALDQPLGEPFHSGDVIYAGSNEPFDEALGQILRVADKMGIALDNILALIRNNNADLSTAIKEVRISFEQLHQLLEKTNQENLVTSIKDASSRFGAVMEQLQRQVHTMEELKILENLAKTSENFSSMTSAMNQPEQLGRLLTDLGNFAVGMSRLGEKLESSWPNIDASLTNFAATAENTKQTAESIKQLSDEIAIGKGNLGKLIKQDDLYLQAVAVMSKIETLMNDLNQYGLLFHSNRTWQKQRSKRMAEMTKVQTPEQMITFFEQELDQISTALSRMSHVVKQAEAKAGQSPENQEVFKKTFREIFNKLEHVQDMVKLYNEQVYGPLEVKKRE